jgi:hypothetical protein
MKKYGLISAIALIVLTNVVVLAGVAYNRSGEPDATVTLTERELHWTNSWNWMDREDSGLRLALKWSTSGYDNYNWDYEQSHWLGEEKLKELGFDTSYPLDDSKASRYYNRQLKRQGYVVLEFDGDAYQKWLKKTEKRIKESIEKLAEEKKPNELEVLKANIRQMEQSMITQSHLFAVDAGADPQMLRTQHPDKSKYIITPAVFDISLQYTYRKKDQPKSPTKRYLRGRVRKILIPEIHVTSDYRSFFTSDIKTHTNIYLPKGKPLSNLEPRYRVTLNYGKRHEPWIAGVKKLK